MLMPLPPLMFAVPLNCNCAANTRVVPVMFTTLLLVILAAPVIAKTPALTVVGPVYVLARVEDNVVVPDALERHSAGDVSW